MKKFPEFSCEVQFQRKDKKIVSVDAEIWFDHYEDSVHDMKPVYRYVLDSFVERVAGHISNLWTETTLTPEEESSVIEKAHDQWQAAWEKYEEEKEKYR